MKTSVAIGQRFIDVSWQLRQHLGPRGRAVARRFVDPFIAPVLGSVHSVTTTEPLVALTLDDGPDEQWTDPILDVLARHRIRATFFMLVEQAEANPTLVRRVIADGHEIGLHGIDHAPLTETDRDVGQVLIEGRTRLAEVSGRPIRWFRPPFGSQSLRTFRAARRVGLEVVVWGPEGSDWEPTRPEEIAARIAGEARPGDILLLHDGMSPAPPPGHPVGLADRAAAVDNTISKLRDAGLGCAALGDLVQSGRVCRSAWFRPAPERPPFSEPSTEPAR